MSDVMIWAHRGASAHAPENTMAAFELAWRQGADGIELDVQVTRDGVPVVLHDETLDRTTDRRGRVSRMTLGEVRHADAGSWFHVRYGGERVPTLNEVFDWARTRVRVNVEIKDAAAADAVLALIQHHPGIEVVVSSFDRRLLRRLRQASPALPLAVLCDRRLWRAHLREAVRLAACAFHPRRDLLTSVMAGQCRQAGLKVYPWTEDRPEGMRQLLRRGADGLFTNDPAAARALLDRTVGRSSPHR
ncbi:MAG: glycerophosphodiester phosphodiesterase [Deltaproteobacteria bacterium]|nr:MAG: glycerophosphodiester phosphodiesterase [Deltaproteobacteria bacterium]